MKFSCGNCGRSYAVDDAAAGRTLKLTCRGCGAVIVAGGAPRAPVERDPFAPAEDDSLEPLPPEPSESPDAERPSFDPFAELAEAARETPGPATRGPSPAAPPSEADSAFADLARELGDVPEMVHRTGELPLVPTARGELTPTPPSAPAAAPPEKGAAPPQKSAARPPAPAAKARRPEPPPPVRRTRSLVVPAVATAVAVGAGAFALLHGGSSARPGAVGASDRAGPVRNELPITPPSPPASAPSAPAQPRAPATPAPDERREEPAVPGSAPAAAAHRGERAPLPAQRPAREQGGRAAPAPGRPNPASAPRTPAVAAVRSPLAAPARAEERPAAPPPSSAPAAAELPPFDAARVDAAFASSRKGFDACVAAARASEPGIALGGRTVTLTLTVNPSGKVLYPTLDDAELSATDLGRCLKREASKISFPAFGGEPVRVQKLLTLK